ncbi:hypothetical protein CFC21_102881 [Triticum aestivum]|uniref:Uncharacterized protein n=3 Tax=Triticum aestivum TaxID=4565 RepID=A0A3B6SGX4_WHEAT|nr:hypothetical protein CFC21_102881 [Triticum aestivum]
MEGVHHIGLGKKVNYPFRSAWWPRCGNPMLCSDGTPLPAGCRWLSLVRFPVVACVEPWVRLSFALSLLLLSLALLLLIRPAAYQSASACCLGLYDLFCHYHSTHQVVIPVLEAMGSSMRFAVPFISVCSRRGWLCSCWCRTRAPSGTDLVLWRSLMNKPRCSYFRPLMLYTHIYTCLPLDWFCLTHKASSGGKAETSSPTVEEKDDNNDQAQVIRNKRMKWQA